MEINYRFDAHRVYADGERYSTGSGLSFFTQDLEQAVSAFETYQQSHPEARYAVEVTRCDTGEVLLHAGPSMRDATASMNRACRARFAKEAA